MSSPAAKQPLTQLAWELSFPLEYVALGMGWPALRHAPRGDGGPVLVIPGLGGGDGSTAVLRSFLRAQGYGARGCGVGRISTRTNRSFDGAAARLLEMADECGPVRLIGVSLGGMLARELARRHPAAVRQIVSLAAPIWRGNGDRHNVARLYKVLRGRPVAPLPFEPEQLQPPLEVPTSAVYTRTDGFVRWQACLESAGALRENIEVYGTHTGLAANPTALWAVADRLAQTVGAWEPFRPPPWVRHFFPTPAVGAARAENEKERAP
jgi:pimeloyl-ACP methyl ester carboxylesterase